MLLTRLSLLLLISCITTHPLFQKYSQLKYYQLRRPLQYFFNLLELKSSFNPMLGSLLSMGDHCSSKAGPFCKITGHQPFQTHALRHSAMNDNERNVYGVLIAQSRQNFQLFDSIMKNEDMRFLIRNELANEFDNILKAKIGDRMHLPEMLSPEFFQAKR